MSVDLDDDWSGQAAYGLDFGAFRLEGQFGMTAGDAISYTSTKPGGITRPTDGNVNLVTGMLNAYVDFDMGPGWTPFIGVGAGLTKAEVEIAGPRPTAPNGPRVTLIDDDQTNVGWQIMAGFAVPVTSNMSVTAQFRYFDDGSFGMYDTSGHSTTVDIKGSSWDTGLRFSF